MATKLNKASVEAIRSYTDVSVKANNALGVVVDALTKQSITPDMLRAPEKGADRTLYTSVQDAIKLGFSTDVQELLQKKPATLSEAEKAEKRYWQQQVGSKLKDIRNAMTKKQVGPTNQRTSLQIIQDQITGAIERIGKLDPENGDAIPDAMDLPTTTKHLKEALAAFLGK